MVKKKNGVICRTLHRGHGSIHEHMQSCMHTQARTATQPSLGIPKSCKEKLFHLTFRKTNFLFWQKELLSKFLSKFPAFAPVEGIFYSIMWAVWGHMRASSSLGHHVRCLGLMKVQTGCVFRAPPSDAVCLNSFIIVYRLPPQGI